MLQKSYILEQINRNRSACVVGKKQQQYFQTFKCEIIYKSDTKSTSMSFILFKHDNQHFLNDQIMFCLEYLKR